MGDSCARSFRSNHYVNCRNLVDYVRVQPAMNTVREDADTTPVQGPVDLQGTDFQTTQAGV
jgi:hypothetical protein